MTLIALMAVFNNGRGPADAIAFLVLQIGRSAINAPRRDSLPIPAICTVAF